MGREGETGEEEVPDTDTDHHHHHILSLNAPACFILPSLPSPHTSGSPHHAAGRAQGVGDSEEYII